MTYTEAKARIRLADISQKKLAELVGASIGESVSSIDINNVISGKSSGSRSEKMKKVIEETDRITALCALRKAASYKAPVLYALKRDGVTSWKDITIFLGDFCFGETVFVFLDGRFYGRYTVGTGRFDLLQKPEE